MFEIIVPSLISSGRGRNWTRFQHLVLYLILIHRNATLFEVCAKNYQNNMETKFHLAGSYSFLHSCISYNSIEKLDDRL